MESPIINTLGFLPLMGLIELVDGTVALFPESALEDRLLLPVHAFEAILSVKVSFVVVVADGSCCVCSSIIEYP